MTQGRIITVEIKSGPPIQSTHLIYDTVNSPIYLRTEVKYLIV